MTTGGPPTRAGTWKRLGAINRKLAVMEFLMSSPGEETPKLEREVFHLKRQTRVKIFWVRRDREG